MKGFNKWLFSVLFLSFVFSIGYSFYFKIKPQVDARAYDVIAQNIVAGNGYREDLNLPVEMDGVVVRAGPVYEYFLASIYQVFGHSYPIVWILQAILHAASAYLIYLICLLIFANSENKERIALWAAAIFGFYPDLIEISAMLMTETLYLFLICLSLYLFFLYVEDNKIQTLAIFAIVFGLTSLTRPPVFFLLPVLLFYLLKKRQFARTLIFGILLVAVLTPWTVRTYQVYGKAMPFGAGGAYNFWIGNHLGGSGEQEPGPELMNYFNNHSVLDSYNKSNAEFKSFIVNHPQDFVQTTFSRINKYFSILRPMGFWFYSSGWRQLLFVMSSAVFSLFVLIASFGGILQTVKLKEKSLHYLLAFTIITPLIIFITVVETRYRFQIYPFLAIFAAYFISSFMQNKKVWWSALWVALVLILANGLLDGLLNLAHFKEKLAPYL